MLESDIHIELGLLERAYPDKEISFINEENFHSPLLLRDGRNKQFCESVYMHKKTLFRQAEIEEVLTFS